MTLVFFVILTVAWILIFFPKVLRVRRSSPLPAAESFKRRLELLAPHPIERSGRWVHLPEDPQQARRNAFRRVRARKRKAFILLLALTATSFLAAVVWPVLWRVHLAAAGLLVTYVVLLVGARRRRLEAIAKIELLPAGGSLDRRAESERASGGVT